MDVSLKRNLRATILTLFICLLVAGVAIGLLIGMKDRNESDGNLTGAGNHPEAHAAGTTFFTTIQSEMGSVAVQVILPESARYGSGAPVVVTVPTFLTEEQTDFYPLKGLEGEGVISISLILPGHHDAKGHASQGDNDYGGAGSLAALRDVIRFALGDTKNSEGFALAELSAIPPAFDAVGLYAFSHPGIAATNVLAQYPEALSGVRYFVGRENPTLDVTTSLELGRFEEGVPVPNMLYAYPDNYAPGAITLDYSTVRYDNAGRIPYFDINTNGRPDADRDYLFGTQVPRMFGKRHYSRSLLRALETNGAFRNRTWPTDLATPEEADATWDIRETSPSSYAALEQYDGLHAMLVFAERDHVQPSADKPHVHQAYDGFRSAGIWTRLNPDAAYVESLSEKLALGYQEHPANSEPTDWNAIESWAYPTSNATNAAYPLAAVLEMADRSHADRWDNDLSEPVTLGESPQSETPSSTNVSWSRSDDGGYWITNPTSGSRLHATILKQGSTVTQTRTLVLVPGGNGGGDTFLSSPKKDARELAEAGYQVVLFDPEGRGLSEGEENNNGSVGQDGFAAIIRFASELSDERDVGVVSLSYGITLASGTLARYPDLPVAFLIDWEGPADRNDTGGCDQDETGHLTGVAQCDDEAFWNEREAVRFIDDITVPYLRLQTERDHAQPDVLSAVRMVNAAVQGSSTWVRLNDDTERRTYDETSPPKMLPDTFDQNFMEDLAGYASDMFELAKAD